MTLARLMISSPDFRTLLGDIRALLEDVLADFTTSESGLIRRRREETGPSEAGATYGSEGQQRPPGKQRATEEYGAPAGYARRTQAAGLGTSQQVPQSSIGEEGTSRPMQEELPSMSQQQAPEQRTRMPTSEEFNQFGEPVGWARKSTTGSQAEGLTRHPTVESASGIQSTPRSGQEPSASYSQPQDTARQPRDTGYFESPKFGASGMQGQEGELGQQQGESEQSGKVHPRVSAFGQAFSDNMTEDRRQQLVHHFKRTMTSVQDNPEYRDALHGLIHYIE